MYSDGSMYAPMMIDIPNPTKCEGCGTILKLSQLERLEKEPKVKNIYECRALGKSDLLKAIDIFPEDELALRLIVWRNYNSIFKTCPDSERIRTDYITSLDSPAYIDNSSALLKLLNSDNEKERLLMAEIHRNLGNFEECLRLIPKSARRNFVSVQKPKSHILHSLYLHEQNKPVPLEQIMVRECELRNRCVVMVDDYRHNLEVEEEQKEQKRIEEEMKDPRWKVCRRGHCFKNVKTECIWCGETDVVDRLDKNIEVQHMDLYIGVLDGCYVLTRDSNIPEQEQHVRKITVDYYKDKFIYFHLDGKNPNPFHFNFIQLERGVISGHNLVMLQKDKSERRRPILQGILHLP